MNSLANTKSFATKTVVHFRGHTQVTASVSDLETKVNDHSATNIPYSSQTAAVHMWRNSSYGR